MKRLTERTEIARAINFKQYPIITIDLADRDEYGIKGCKVCIDNGTFRTGEPYYVDATCRVYSDEKKLVFQSYGSCLHDSFGYSDIEKMLEYANAPVIQKDQDVLIVIIDSANRQAYQPIIAHTSNRIDPHCMTPINFTERIGFDAFF